MTRWQKVGVRSGLTRMQLRYAAAFPDAEIESLPQEDRARYEYVAGSRSPDDEALPDLDLARTLFGHYRNLVIAQLPARIERVLEAVPASCEAVECFALKSDILVSIDPDFQVQPGARLGTDPEYREAIETRFADRTR